VNKNILEWIPIYST